MSKTFFEYWLIREDHLLLTFLIELGPIFVCSTLLHFKKRPFISCYFFAIQPSLEMEIFAFCVITFEPNKIQTIQAPQNDRLNLSFVKDNLLVGKKWPVMVVKWPFILSDSFLISVYNYTKEAIWHLSIWKNWCFGEFYHFPALSK